MKAIKVQTTHQLRTAEVASAKDAVISFAEKRPGLLASRLALNPSLANGLSNFDYIVECLLKGGQHYMLERMLDSKSLGKRERQIIVKLLLTRI